MKSSIVHVCAIISGGYHVSPVSNMSVCKRLANTDYFAAAINYIWSVVWLCVFACLFLYFLLLLIFYVCICANERITYYNHSFWRALSCISHIHSFCIFLSRGPRRVWPAVRRRIMFTFNTRLQFSHCCKFFTSNTTNRPIDCTVSAHFSLAISHSGSRITETRTDSRTAWGILHYIEVIYSSLSKNC